MSSEEFNNNDEVEFENEEEAGSSSENEGSHSMQVGDPLDTSIRPREKASTWPESILDDLVDIVCENEMGKLHRLIGEEELLHYQNL